MKIATKQARTLIAMTLCLLVAWLIINLVPSDQPASSARPQAAIDSATLDNYTGYYQWADDDLVTKVTRESDRLFLQYPVSDKQIVILRDPTHFHLPNMRNDSRFSLDSAGRAQRLIFDVGNTQFVATRIDPVLGQQIFTQQFAKWRDQAETPGNAAALRHLIESMLADQPDYASLSADLAQQVRAGYPEVQAALHYFGALHEIRFVGLGPSNEDIFRVTQDHQYTRWHIVVGHDGEIKMLRWETESPQRIPM